MKHFLLMSSLTAWAFAAAAQSPADPGAVQVRASLSRMEIPAHINRMTLGDFSHVKGTYDLSNGQVMRLSKRGQRIFAQIDNAPLRELIAVGDYDYIARDRQLKISLTVPEYGETNGYVQMLAAASAQGMSLGETAIRSIGILAAR